MKNMSIHSPSLVLAAAAILFSTSAMSQDAPFGNAEDIDFARQLWSVMTDTKLVGDGSIKVRPFAGSEPHGTIQEVLSTVATVDGHEGRLLVKRNHGGKDDLTVEDVYDNPTEFLAAVTVMFKRADGYDPDNQNWFWAKYLPDGELDKNPTGVALAGRVAKGMSEGCIACHTALGGADLETLTSK